MDRSLTKVVGYAKDTRDDQQVMEDGIQECVEVLRQDSLQVGQILEKSAKHTDFFTPAGDGIDRPDGAEQALYRTCQVGFGRLQ